MNCGRDHKEMLALIAPLIEYVRKSNEAFFAANPHDEEFDPYVDGLTPERFRRLSTAIEKRSRRGLPEVGDAP